MGGPFSVSCATPDHITIADMGPALTSTRGETLANARLIAAAPDLLAERDRLLAENARLIQVIWDLHVIDELKQLEEKRKARDWTKKQHHRAIALNKAARAAFVPGGRDE
jgi:hypothetical protein